MSNSVAGLDMSLTGAGVAVLEDGEVRLATVSTVPGDYPNIYDRVDDIVSQVLFHIPAHVELICIEEAFFHAKNKRNAMNIIGLAYAMRKRMTRNKLRWMEVAASQVKKFGTGKGAGNKDQVTMHVLKRWGIEAADNNQADACVLAKIAEAIISEENFQPVTLIGPQREVLDKLGARHAK